MATIALVGCGNIGSHLVYLLARLSAVERLILIDPDSYEEANLATQNIERRDVGKPKVVALDEGARRIRPGLHVESHTVRVETIPPGCLRGVDVLTAGLDNNETRQYLNQLAFRIGIPWIDGGVNADEGAVRVNVYKPALTGSPCIECGWHDDDYRQLSQNRPCEVHTPAASTNAPSHLGALVAALMSAECVRLLEQDDSMVGRQYLVSMNGHRSFLTRFERNPQCRFDHDTWSIETLAQSPAELTLGQAFELPAGRSATSLAIESQVFTTSRVCSDCGRSESCLELERALAGRRCAGCGGDLVAPGDAIRETLARNDRVVRRHAAHSLVSLGLQPGDLLTLASPGKADRHFQLGGETP